jgi:hypothetical protein
LEVEPSSGDHQSADTEVSTIQQVFDLRGEERVVAATQLNLALMHVARRAEMADPEVLAETFVDVGPLFAVLTSPDHQVLYGRRGTGKTHALKYLARVLEDKGDVAVYLDLRNIGSSVGIYADPDLPLTERGSRLLVDTLTCIQNELVDDALSLAEAREFSYGPPLATLDHLADEITRVSVEGDVEVQIGESENIEASSGGKLGVAAGRDLGLTIEREDASSSSGEANFRTVRKGPERYHVNFGTISRLLDEFVKSVPVGRLWILLDEWSSVPLDLQPLLADLLRRSLFPVERLTVKIGAIEQQSRFRVSTPEGGYLGIEVGADASADVDLDDYMVFGNDPDRAKAFFQQLLFRHVRAVLLAEGRSDDVPASAPDFVNRAFTQLSAFEELVRAAEGVPRDAINVANLAAQTANDRQLSVPYVRQAARTWYLRDKESAVSSDPTASALLHFIQDDVIGQRRARAFLLEQKHGADPLISALYNARVLHVIKRGVAANDQPGVRFDVYAIDFGAYVQLTSTAKATLGLFEMNDDGGPEYVEVPADDYRSIRRAILNLDEFRARLLVPRLG